jgi:hypothetical protein
LLKPSELHGEEFMGDLLQARRQCGHLGGKCAAQREHPKVRADPEALAESFEAIVQPA